MSDFNDDNLSGGLQGSELSDSELPENFDEDITDRKSDTSSDSSSGALPISKQQLPGVPTQEAAKNSGYFDSISPTRGATKNRGCFESISPTQGTTKNCGLRDYTPNSRGHKKNMELFMRKLMWRIPKSFKITTAKARVC